MATLIPIEALPFLCYTMPRNILQLCPSIGKTSGGLGPVVVNLTLEQQRLGDQAHLWCIEPPEGVESAVADSKLSRESVVTFATVGPQNLAFSLDMRRAATSQKSGAYDVLHQHGIWTFASEVVCTWRRRHKGPTVVGPHGALAPYALKRSIWKKRVALALYELQNLRQATCLCACAITEVQNFRAFGLRNPIAVIPNGIPDEWLHLRGDKERFVRKYALAPTRRNLLFLSRVHQQKGLPLLFQAIAQVKPQFHDWRLLIVGPDEAGHRRELEQLADKLRIQDSVHFLGGLFGSDKLDAYAAADIFILPTHSESFSIAVLEALGAGLPVITTYGAPWQELQTHRCGWWTTISVEGIRDALLDATSRPRDELAMMGQRGKSLVSERYTWREAAQKTLKLYGWLLGQWPMPDFVIMD